LFKPFKESELLDALLRLANIHRESGEPPNLGVRPEAAASRLRILIAEDNPVNQMVAVRLLERHGHTVSAVSNGREAIEAVEAGSYDMALLDVQMPVVDGLEAARLIRKTEQQTGRTRLPLIALTAHSMAGDRERCLRAGMDGYVAKPVKPQDLFRVIESLRAGTPAPEAAFSMDPPAGTDGVCARTG
jgi:CheY-like chemotaxis protein